ncbi:MAG: ATP-grasp domain-containing protein [Candidatus Thorarchaeota archaeon]|jgi:glutathione synthase/RimK-type ligase-like ATP-grasp enzyme
MIGYFRRKAYEETDKLILCHDDIFPVLYEEIELRNGGLYARDINLETLDAFYFRAVGAQYEIVNRLVKIAVDAGKPVIDKYLLDGVGARTKKLMHETFDDVIRQPTWTLVRGLNNIAEHAEYPLVAKVSRGGRQGMGTFLVKNEDDIASIRTELERRLENHEPHVFDLGKREWIVQEYIPNDGDYRAFVIGGECIGVTKRGPKQDSLVMNKSTRGSRRFKNGRWPRDIGNMAVNAANTMGIDIAGVDIVRHSRTREPYVIEVNEAPRFNSFARATKIDVGARIVEYLRSIANGGTQN